MKFFVGIARYRLSMGECASLKDKRRLLKSITDRLGNSRMVAVSEVGTQDSRKTGTLALACLSSSMEMIQVTLDRARRTIEATGADLVDVEQWVLNPEDLEA